MGRAFASATLDSVARHVPSALALLLLMARPALGMVSVTTLTNANVIRHMKADHALCSSARKTALCTASATRVHATAVTATPDAIAVCANARMLAPAMVSARVASVTAQAHGQARPAMLLAAPRTAVDPTVVCAPLASACATLRTPSTLLVSL